MAAPLLLEPHVAASGLAALGSLGSTFMNGILNRSAMADQVAASKELMDYQWNKFQSPLAQVNAMAHAGINPAVAFGQGGTGFISTPSAALPTNTTPQIGGINDIASFVKAMAEAKKANVDIKNVEVDTQAKQFELELSRVWSNPEKIVNLTQAWKNVMLSDDAHSLNEWKVASEKAISGLKGVERDTAQKILDNMDIQIKQENNQRAESIKLTQEKQKTEKTSQSANVAAANASNTQASLNREMARYQRVIADVEESSSPFKLENLLRHYAASNMISDADYQEAYRRYERLKTINADNDKHSWNKALDSFMFYLEEHVKGLSPFVSAATK